LLPNVLNEVNLQVFHNDNWSTDIILGRDFMSANRLIVTFDFSESEYTDRVKLFKEIAATELIDEITNSNEITSLDILTDFGKEVDQKVYEFYSRNL